MPLVVVWVILRLFEFLKKFLPTVVWGRGYLKARRVTLWYNLWFPPVSLVFELTLTRFYSTVALQYKLYAMQWCCLRNNRHCLQTCSHHVVWRNCPLSYYPGSLIHSFCLFQNTSNFLWAHGQLRTLIFNMLSKNFWRKNKHIKSFDDYRVTQKNIPIYYIWEK